MRKRMSKIVSVLLVSALVVSTGSVAQAEDVKGSAGKVQISGEALGGNAEAEVKVEQDEGLQGLEAMSVSGVAKEITAKATTSNDIPMNKMVTGTEKEESWKLGSVSYANTSTYKKTGNYYGWGKKVKFTEKGTLYLTATSRSASNIWFGLFKDSNFTQPAYANSYTFVNAGNYWTQVLKVPKGTYYIGLYSNISQYYVEGSVEVNADVRAVFCAGNDRTIKVGKQVAVGQKEVQTNYFKFKATQTGYITVPTDNYVDKVTLCNSKKKALSTAVSSKYAVFGVKKGTTYYIKIKSYSNSTGAYVFKVLNKKVKESSGTKQSNAKTIKKKAKKNGTIQAGSSQADWYKFKLTKANTKKILINLKGRTNEKMKITVYRGTKKLYSGSFPYYKGGYEITGTNLTKGTYYIKVERGTKKSSGYYTLTWQ